MGGALVKTDRRFIEHIMRHYCVGVFEVGAGWCFSIAGFLRQHGTVADQKQRLYDSFRARDVLAIDVALFLVGVDY